MFRSDPDLTNENDIRKFIDARAKKVVQICSDKFAPCELTLENTFPKFWVLPKKKTYCGKKANYVDKSGKECEGEIALKGFGAVKRDRCDEAKRICNVVIESVLNQNTMSTELRIAWFQEQLKGTPWGVVKDFAQLSPYVLTAELGSEYKQEDSMVPLLAGLIQEDTGSQPEVGDRLSYVVAYFDDSRLARKRNMPPRMFLKQKMMLDVAYYLEKQIYSCLKQVLCLPCHEHLLTKMKECIDAMIKKWRLKMVFNRKPKFNFAHTTKKDMF